MKIIAHDEDSMTNLFFSEVHRHEKLEDFLALIEWRYCSSLPFDVSAAELHQQVNFSEFGRPDAIIPTTPFKLIIILIFFFYVKCKRHNYVFESRSLI